jgi:hypothetical protein
VALLWKRDGAAALCALAAQSRAHTLDGDIARLLVLAKAMRACTLVNDTNGARVWRDEPPRAPAGVGPAGVSLVADCPRWDLPPTWPHDD